MKYLYELTGVNLLYVRENANDPGIGLLSQKSQIFTSSGGSKAYRPLTNFDRNQEIILFGETKPHILDKGGHESKLILKNVLDSNTYELDLSNTTAPAFLSFFPQFIIKDEVPPGNYEVRLSVHVEGEGRLGIGGAYYRIISIN